MDGADESKSQYSFCLLEIGGSVSRRNSRRSSIENRRAFTEYREVRVSDSGGSVGSLHSLNRLENETSPLQECLKSNNRGGEGASSSYFAQLRSIERSLLRVSKRKTYIARHFTRKCRRAWQVCYNPSGQRKKLSRRIFYHCQALRRRLGTSPHRPRL